MLFVVLSCHGSMIYHYALFTTDGCTQSGELVGVCTFLVYLYPCLWIADAQAGPAYIIYGGPG